MLHGLAHSFKETAIPLSSLQHIKELCFFYFLVRSVLLLWAGTTENPKVVLVSSLTYSGWHVVSPPYVVLQRLTGFTFSIHDSYNVFLKPSLLGFFLFEYISQVADLSLCLYAWKDLITWIWFSLFIPLALCFTPACFIYGSHILWLQLQATVNFSTREACAEWHIFNTVLQKYLDISL